MKFGYTIIYVTSVPDTLAFYDKAFGFKTRFLHESNMYGELDTGETALAFASLEMGDMNLGDQFLPVQASGKPFGIELAFVAEDVDAAFKQAVDAGATAIKPPTAKPWGQTVAYVRSLEGSLIELCSPIGG
ncbi:VOC family protein [Sapientia aquatica]|jgi:uncharacterized glyoxalase superfamily protein PhnB|uniref:VOC family protein n=1 Tax=Sapientia aquatica TaxID=1549640 RepID=A0A4R5W0L4_9BURK|nr:VOC family protein [Sapientia aquatica]TDK65513.1 VOC family protein [Sapientia aquatica]